MSSDLYAILADLTLVHHAAFVLFVLGGQVLILIGWLRRWKWVRHVAFRITHLLAIGYVILESWFGIACPLTLIEIHFRQLAGVAGYETSFIAYWLNRLLFYNAPGWVFTTAYSLFGLVVLVSFIAYPPQRKTRITKLSGG